MGILGLSRVYAGMVKLLLGYLGYRVGQGLN